MTSTELFHSTRLVWSGKRTENAYNFDENGVLIIVSTTLYKSSYFLRVSALQDFRLFDDYDKTGVQTCGIIYVCLYCTF